MPNYSENTVIYGSVVAFWAFVQYNYANMLVTYVTFKLNFNVF